MKKRGAPMVRRDLMRFQLVRVGDLELFEENEVDRDELPDWIPFASFKGEPQFLAIKTVAPFAIGMWEHEHGEIYTVWASLADFVARVIDKATKTPFELLAKTLDKVSKLVHADALPRPWRSSSRRSARCRRRRCSRASTTAAPRARSTCTG